jgi:large subunit ribosomal protein L22
MQNSEDIISKASHKGARLSPRRVRAIANLIRDEAVFDAQNILFLLTTKGSDVLLKVLRSAVANAKQKNPSLTEEGLIVHTITVDQGPPFMKKWRPRAHGRATKIKRLSSHITIELAANEF